MSISCLSMTISIKRNIFRFFYQYLSFVSVENEIDELQRLAAWPAIGKHEQRAMDRVGSVEKALFRPYDAINPEWFYIGTEVTETDVANGAWIV